MGRDPRPWDPGLQNERTSLAWQRTVLAGLGCALLAARLLVSLSWPVAVATAALALVGATLLNRLGRLRFRRNAAALHHRAPLADGRAPVLVAALAVLTCLSGAAFVLLA